uniref:IP20223p n=1 Tax=Drosophila melanogaster TaxID=7227 RepID=B3DND6_DROME|nr:IP20223p [Drosophila melanogaster]ACD99493.1 IP20323p [Drosophila melanogaster]ACD99507.1 IP20523p [Drosophila melanogaster]
MGNGAQTQQYTVGKYLKRLVQYKWRRFGQEWSLPTLNALPWIRSLPTWTIAI